MWLKMCLLLVYILLLFILTRILEALSWCESGYGGALSRQLLDPMVLSVARLKALLEQRGISYEGIVEKSELSSLVDASGQVSAEESEMSQVEATPSSETNFTSGAHFIEQVEDAKDSVWLVQVVSNIGHFRVMNGARWWKAIKEKASKFGVRTGFLDCSLDLRYCNQKGWQSSFLLLALPSQFEKKASVTMYNYTGPVSETTAFHWLWDKLDERIQRIKDPASLHQQWQDFSNKALDPEIRAVLFTQSSSAPLFYSALSVKFPGRVKFGLVCLKSSDAHYPYWKSILGGEKMFPSYVIYTAEKNYTYGMRPGEQYVFSSMERFLKLLHPCLNDVFIASFCVANILSWFEFFISNCNILRRLRKFIWCMFKYNIAVIMLWLPIIGIFQMPYLDRIPLLALKVVRNFSTSQFGTILRGDYSFYLNKTSYVYVSFGIYLFLITVLCKKYREVEQNDDDWFNFRNMRTQVYLRPPDIFEPMRISGYDLLGGLDVFGSRLSQPSLWLYPSISLDYIKHLPTWRYCPQSLAERAAENSRKMEMALKSSSLCTFTSRSDSSHSEPPCLSVSKSEDKRVTVRSVPEREKSHPLFSSPIQTTSDVARMQHEHRSCSTHKNSVTTHQLDTACEAISCPSVECESSTSAPAADCVDRCPSFHSQNSKLSRASHSACDTSHPCGTEADDGATPSHRPSINSNTTCLASVSSQTSTAYSEITSTATRNPTPSSSTSSSSSGFPEGYLESQQCVICLDEYVPFTMLCGLPCGHVFHETCIISWLNRDKHFCPMCRWPSYKIHHNFGILQQRQE